MLACRYRGSPGCSPSRRRVLSRTPAADGRGNRRGSFGADANLPATLLTYRPYGNHTALSGLKSISTARRPPSFRHTPARRSGDARTQPACSFAVRFGRDLRTAGQIHQQAQRLDHGALAHRAAADCAETMLAVDDAAVARGSGEMDEPDRFAG